MPSKEVQAQRLKTVIAGEVCTADDVNAALAEWRDRFDIAQTTVAEKMETTPSVVSDYENGRRTSPGVEFVKKYVTALLEADIERGGDAIHEYHGKFKLVVRQ